MPELPEVEITVNGLRPKISGRRVTGAWFDVPAMIRTPEPQVLARRIRDLWITDVSRRGKYILIHLSNQSRIKNSRIFAKQISDRFASILLIHQRMSGHLLYGKWRIDKKNKVESLLQGAFRDKVNGYIHFILFLDNGWQVALSDARKFGTIEFGSKHNMEARLAHLGAEPLDPNFDSPKFSKLLDRGKNVKTLLLDQRLIAGLGNIYSSEALFLAGIHPARQARSLKDRERAKLWESIRGVLLRGIRRGGTSFSSFRNSQGKEGQYGLYRLVYGRREEPCPHCKTRIQKVTIAQRSTYYCSKCQK